MEDIKRIGLIGVGNMGFHFANRLLKAGYELIIHDKSTKALEYFKNESAIIGDSPLAVANQAGIVFVSLPTPSVVKQVVLGENGLVLGKKIHTYVDLSTTGHKVALEVERGLKNNGIKALDAPVSGGVQGAKDGTLAVMVSGEKEIFNQVKPMLEIIGRNVFYVGDEIGQGQIVKLANNLLSGTAMAITSEAVVLGKKAGIDPKVLISIFNKSSGRNTATIDKFPKAIITNTFDYGFSTNLMYKDLKLCMELSEDLEIPMWLGAGVTQLWKYIVSQGGGERDFTTIIQYLEEMVGLIEKVPSVNN